MLLLLFLVAVDSAAVGPDAPYVAPSISLPPPPPPAVDVAQWRETIRQHARSLALLVSAALLVITLASCIASSDTCVRRRLNWRRRLPIGVDDAPPSD